MDSPVTDHGTLERERHEQLLLHLQRSGNDGLAQALARRLAEQESPEARELAAKAPLVA